MRTCFFIFCLLAIQFVGWSQPRPAFAQECPHLPKAFPYHDLKKRFYQHDLPTYELIELSEKASKHELEQYFNRSLKKIQSLTCYTNTVLQERVFLFQTIEYKGDSLGLRTNIEDKSDLNKPTNPKSTCFTYGSLFQRDLSENDSTLISNWYIKRFTGNELKEAIHERTSYASIADSLNLELAKIKAVQNTDWHVQDRTMKPLRERRTQLLQIRDSIDFLLYPSLKETLKPWYEQFHTEVLTNPGTASFSTFRKQINREDDPFLGKTFKLHHGFVDDPYSGKSIVQGNSAIHKGSDIFNAPLVEDDYSPWRDPRATFCSISDKYLVVMRTESNIGETYWDIKHSYFIYEAID